jgi:hypothetical protein
MAGSVKAWRQLEALGTTAMQITDSSAGWFFTLAVRKGNRLACDVSLFLGSGDGLI